MAHFTMRGRVVPEPESEFRAWLARQPTFAQTQAWAPADATCSAAGCCARPAMACPGARWR